jgi:hypothetical protein
MKGTFIGRTTNHRATGQALSKVTFQEALNDYREVIGNGRIRTIMYKFNNTDLKGLIEYHFRTKFHKSTYGDMCEISYKGIKYTIVFHCGDFDRVLFSICESY